jgi:hypothetical protein
MTALHMFDHDSCFRHNMTVVNQQRYLAGGPQLKKCRALCLVSEVDQLVLKRNT